MPQHIDFFNEISELHDEENTSCVGKHLPDIMDLRVELYAAAVPNAKGKRTKRLR